MRIAALYDIHGNLPALEAVLDEVHAVGVDEIVIGGDVLPGPMPRETLAALRSLAVPVRYLRGNGDREVLELRAGGDAAAVPAAFRDVIRWNAGQLTTEDAETVADWPAVVEVHDNAVGHVLFCHATPRSDTEIFTRLTPEERLRAIFDDGGAPLVICGHTHMPFDRTVGRTRVVNAGSVGMPFGEPGAYWLLLTPDVELRRTSYDLTAAAARIRRTAYPQAEDFAARNVLQPPSEHDILRMFATAELR